MKILFIQKEGGIFGAENYQLKIIPALLKQGIEIEFLRLYTDYQGGKGGRFIELLQSYGIKTHEINIGRFLNPTNLWKIHRLIKAGKFDIVHTHLIHADLHGALVRTLFNRKLKLVSTKHGYDNNFTAQHGFNASKQGLTPYFLISRFAERCMTGSFTITHALHRFFIETGLTTPSKMNMIHYGFDFQQPTGQWRSEQFRVYKKQLFIAGRLVRFKGHRYVIEAMPKLLERFPDAGLVIAGSGDMEEELKQLTKTLGVADNVTFAGYSSEIPKWMFNSDVVLVPSVSEGFGVVLLEAFNSQVPVVAFDVPACNEIIENGRTGFLVKPYDIADMANTIIHVFDHPARRSEVVQQAYARLKEHFNLNRMVQETVSFYKNIMSK